MTFLLHTEDKDGGVTTRLEFYTFKQALAIARAKRKEKGVYDVTLDVKCNGYDVMVYYATQDEVLCCRSLRQALIDERRIAA